MGDDRYCVGVWGHYNGANLGDDLVTSIVLDAARRRRPHSELRAFSMDPEDTRRRHGVRAWPIMVRSLGPGGGASGWRRIVRGLGRRVAKVALEIPHLLRSYRALRPVDQLVVAGSGQLLDSWGTWGHPYTLFKWTVLARLARTELLLLSVGAGPFETRLGRFFVRRAVAMAGYVSVRDSHTVQVLRDIGVTRELPVCPDMAFGFEAFEAAQPARESEGLTVGLNPMPHASERYRPVGDDEQYRTYVQKLARMSDSLSDQGARVVLFSSQTVADTPALADSLAALKNGHGEVTCAPVTGVDDLVSTIRGCDYVIATRFHCVVLSLVFGVPVVGLAYDPKTREVMRAGGVEAFCHDIESFDAQEVIEQIGELRRRDAEIREQLRTRVPALRDTVNQQFDLVFGAPEERDGIRDGEPRERRHLHASATTPH